MDFIQFGFHLFALALSVFGTWYNYFKIEVGHQGMGGKFKFLTFWNICFQSFYFGLCLITDVTETKPNPANPDQRTTLQRLRDVFHSSIVFPTTMFVSVTFWVLFSVNRELVHPKELDAFVPVWFNHLMHTTILPLIVIDKLVTHHHYPKRLYGLLGTVFLALMYVIWILVIAYLDNFWVYPVLGVMATYQKVLFITACIAFYSSFYVLGESVTTYIWGKSFSGAKPRNRVKKGSKKTK